MDEWTNDTFGKMGKGKLFTVPNFGLLDCNILDHSLETHSF